MLQGHKVLEKTEILDNIVCLYGFYEHMCIYISLFVLGLDCNPFTNLSFSRNTQNERWEYLKEDSAPSYKKMSLFFKVWGTPHFDTGQDKEEPMHMYLSIYMQMYIYIYVCVALNWLLPCQRPIEQHRRRFWRVDGC